MKLQLALALLPVLQVAGDSLDCLWSVDGLQYDLSPFRDFQGIGPDVVDSSNSWQVTSLCGKNQHTACMMGGSVQALTTWWTPRSADDLTLTCFTPASIYEDPIEARVLDEHLAVKNNTDAKGFQLYVPHGELCNKEGVTSGSIINVLCDESDSGIVHGRFGDELDGGTCWTVIDVHSKAGCSDVPAPPEPKPPIGEWKGSIECIENCGFFKKPKEFPTQATFSMAIDHCPDVLDYNDGTFAVDGWEGGKFKVGFLNVNLCKSSKFAAELYDESGNAGELDIPMDEESLAFEGTFIAYTGKENSYRHIKYKAVGEYVAN